MKLSFNRNLYCQSHEYITWLKESSDGKPFFPNREHFLSNLSENLSKIFNGKTF